MRRITSIFLLFLSIYKCSALSDVTNEKFSNVPHGMIAAFGDFNADKHTDIFVISAEGTSLLVYFAQEKEFTSATLLQNTTLKIANVVPADYDGDLQMDVLVSFNKGDGKVTSTIYWGSGNSLKTDGALTLPDMEDQPLLMDYNADMIPDLFGEKRPGERTFWLMSESRGFTELQMKNGNQTTFDPLHKPQSSGFVDLNNDLTADLCIVSVKDNKVQLEFWINTKGKLVLSKTVPIDYKEELKVVGQFSYADLDGDLNTNPFVPACEDTECTKSLVLVYDEGKWVKLPIGFGNDGLKWNFIPMSKSGAPDFMSVYPVLRIGDFNLDGYPDVLAVLGNATGSLHRGVVMYNKECSSDCGGFSRTFEVDWGTWLENHDTRSLLPAFFDLNDDGILDVISSSMTSKNVPLVNIREHDFVDDACFMKVTVVSGRCSYNCPAGRKPYGVNQPGPVIRYRTTDLSGNLKHKIAFQFSQSAYLPLQLPYTIFGLGQTPNFVDTLEVGIPTNSSKALHRSWMSVIPNSQLLIIPHPIQEPSSWINKLFVMPSRLMMLTGAALLGTCGFIAGIVGILHWRDKIEDKREKRQEAQRFHFDAM